MIGRMYRTWWFCGLLLASYTSAHAETFRTVALTGQQPPGVPIGVAFDQFREAVLDTAGRVAFSATLTGDPINNINGSGIWSEGAGTLALVARADSQAQGLPAGAKFSINPGHIALQGGDQIAFLAGVTGTGVDSSNRSGFWSGTSATYSPLVRKGDPAPGLPVGTVLGEVETVFLNTAGKTIFFAPLEGPSVDDENGDSIWTTSGGALALVARQGEHAAGTPSGVTYNFLGHPTINSVGQIAFAGTLLGGPPVSGEDRGIWSNSTGSLALIARIGGPAPGAGGGVSFADVQSPVINAAGHVAFKAWLSGSGVNSLNDRGVWFEHSGSIDLVVREGDHAPGTPVGVSFEAIGPPMVNAAGEIAFAGSVRGDGVNGNDLGVWVRDTTGILRIIVREGDQLEVAPGDFRTVQSISFECDCGSDESSTSVFNAQGQIVFRAIFTDRTEGVFVSNVAAVPEAYARK